VDARAKINLFLEVLARRDDGYHNLVSVFQEIDLADRLSAEPAAHDRIELLCDRPDLPTDGRNLVVRAAERLREVAGIRAGIRFTLQKRIAPGSGLGGGSSDAAAALRLANAVWRLDLPREALAEIGAAIGADVPFFLWGGTCLCEERGDRITPLAESAPRALLLVIPDWSIATPAAYGQLAAQRLGTRKPDAFLAALRRGDLEGIARESFNRFEEPVFAMEPRQRRLHAALADSGLLCVRMSGTGSAVWGLPTQALDPEDLCTRAAPLPIRYAGVVHGCAGAIPESIHAPASGKDPRAAV